MAMKVATFNGCKVYNLSSGKVMPQWLTEKKKRSLSKDDDYRHRIDLIQDFEMKTASQCIKMTKDGEHIIVTGTYPPLVRCYTVSDMAMKFQRGLSCEVVAFETLSDDYGKLAFLLADRTINLHAPYGTHYSLRVPKFGRDLAYEWASCDLFIAASGNEIYRLNLELGQFREPFQLGFQGCNKIDINPVHQLISCGGESSICEFWDPRARKAVSKLQVDKTQNIEITSLKSDSDGLTLGVGTSTGQCILYDIRSSNPLYTKDHQYGYPVNNIVFHNTSKHVISSDKKIIKIWERSSGDSIGKILTNIETPADINNIHVVNDNHGQSSGLIFIAGEQSRVMTYFVPQLGPAPRWCSFLEGITEELEESATQNVYEDYKFVTAAEVEELGASGLIGTPMLKGYMHGFFMEVSLYTKLRAVSKPFEYEEHRKKRIRDKIDEKRQSRITALKRLPKVNRALAEKFTKNSQKDVLETTESPATTTVKIVDDRFSALFKREEFEQDPDSIDYKLRYPTGRDPRQSGNDDSDDELGMGYKANDDVGSFARTTQRMLENKKISSSRPTSFRMYELDEGVTASTAAFSHTESARKQRRIDTAMGEIPLSQRMKKIDQNDNKKIDNKVRYVKGEDGLSREMSYMPSGDRKESRDARNSNLDKSNDRRAMFEERGSRGGGRGRGRGRGGGRGSRGRGGGGRRR
eukprot:gene9529-19816_t